MKKIILSILSVTIFSVSLIAQETAMLKSPSLRVAAGADTLAEIKETYRKKPHIAILPFTNANAQAKEAEFGRTVSAMLATALRNQTNFIVLERNELHQVLTEQVLQESGLTKEQTQELAKIYNVEVILTGDISLINNTLHIDARLVEIKSSEIVVALYGTCHDLDQIRTVVEDLANQLEGTYLRQWMGNLSITSEPAGAEIYLENKFIGFTEGKKPLLVKNLLEGAYHLKLIRGGYEDWQGNRRQRLRGLGLWHEFRRPADFYGKPPHLAAAIDLLLHRVRSNHAKHQRQHRLQAQSEKRNQNVSRRRRVQLRAQLSGPAAKCWNSHAGSD